VCLPSALETVEHEVPPERIEDGQFRRLYETIRASPSARDMDVAALVRNIEDPALASLAVELFERGRAVAACRDAADTGPGPLARLLEEAVRALKEMEAEAHLAAQREAVRRGEGDPARALEAFAKARARHQGFLPPAARRRRAEDPEP